MSSRVLGVDDVIRQLANLERRAHGAARKAVGETTRKVKLGIRREVQSIFRKNARAGNAIRSVVYDNTQAPSGPRPGRAVVRGRHKSDTAGVIFSKFGRGKGAAYQDYLLPYITGRDILPKKGKYLAVPLLPGKRNRKPTPEMQLQPVRSGGQLFLVKHQKRKSVFMFLLLKKVPIRRRLRLSPLLRNGQRTLTAETIRAYAAMAGEMKR